MRSNGIIPHTSADDQFRWPVRGADLKLARRLLVQAIMPDIDEEMSETALEYPADDVTYQQSPLRLHEAHDNYERDGTIPASIDAEKTCLCIHM